MPQYFVGKRASSYMRIADPDLPNGYIEREMRMCAHCAYQWPYEPEKKEGYFLCSGCAGYLCKKPMCHKECKVQEQFLEEEEKRQAEITYLTTGGSAPLADLK